MRAAYGDCPVVTLKRRNVRDMIEAKSKTPAAANRWLSLMVILIDLALDLEWPGIDSNVARTVQNLLYKRGFHAWDESEVAAFREHWSLGTRQRLALEMLLGTAQRSADVRKMGQRQIVAESVSLVQQKTAEPITIPLLAELKEALWATPLTGRETVLVTSRGKAFAEKYFYNWFKRACSDAGLSNCCPHGLRKAAAVRLAEADCSPHQIQAITGHKTLKEVERYTREANQKRLAKQAFRKLGGTAREQET
jgi:integrase